MSVTSSDCASFKSIRDNEEILIKKEDSIKVVEPQPELAKTQVQHTEKKVGNYRDILRKLKNINKKYYPEQNDVKKEQMVDMNENNCIQLKKSSASSSTTTQTAISLSDDINYATTGNNIEKEHTRANDDSDTLKDILETLDSKSEMNPKHSSPKLLAKQELMDKIRESLNRTNKILNQSTKKKTPSLNHVRIKLDKIGKKAKYPMDSFDKSFDKQLKMQHATKPQTKENSNKKMFTSVTISPDTTIPSSVCLSTKDISVNSLYRLTNTNKSNLNSNTSASRSFQELVKFLEVPKSSSKCSCMRDMFALQQLGERTTKKNRKTIKKRKLKPFCDHKLSKNSTDHVKLFRIKNKRDIMYKTIIVPNLDLVLPKKPKTRAPIFKRRLKNKYPRTKISAYPVSLKKESSIDTSDNTDRIALRSSVRRVASTQSALILDKNKYDKFVWENYPELLKGKELNELDLEVTPAFEKDEIPEETVEKIEKAEEELEELDEKDFFFTTYSDNLLANNPEVFEPLKKEKSFHLTDIIAKKTEEVKAAEKVAKEMAKRNEEMKKKEEKEKKIKEKKKAEAKKAAEKAEKKRIKQEAKTKAKEARKAEKRAEEYAKQGAKCLDISCFPGESANLETEAKSKTKSVPWGCIVVSETTIKAIAMKSSAALKEVEEREQILKIRQKQNALQKAESKQEMLSLKSTQKQIQLSFRIQPYTPINPPSDLYEGRNVKHKSLSVTVEKTNASAFVGMKVDKRKKDVLVLYKKCTCVPSNEIINPKEITVQELKQLKNLTKAKLMLDCDKYSQSPLLPHLCEQIEEDLTPYILPCNIRCTASNKNIQTRPKKVDWIVTRHKKKLTETTTVSTNTGEAVSEKTQCNLTVKIIPKFRERNNSQFVYMHEELRGFFGNEIIGNTITASKCTKNQIQNITSKQMLLYSRQSTVKYGQIFKLINDIRKLDFAEKSIIKKCFKCNLTNCKKLTPKPKAHIESQHNCRISRNYLKEKQKQTFEDFVNEIFSQPNILNTFNVSTEKPKSKKYGLKFNVVRNENIHVTLNFLSNSTFNDPIEQDRDLHLGTEETKFPIRQTSFQYQKTTDTYYTHNIPKDFPPLNSKLSCINEGLQSFLKVLTESEMNIFQTSKPKHKKQINPLSSLLKMQAPKVFKEKKKPNVIDITVFNTLFDKNANPNGFASNTNFKIFCQTLTKSEQLIFADDSTPCLNKESFKDNFRSVTIPSCICLFDNSKRFQKFDTLRKLNSLERIANAVRKEILNQRGGDESKTLKKIPKIDGTQESKIKKEKYLKKVPKIDGTKYNESKIKEAKHLQRVPKIDGTKDECMTKRRERKITFKQSVTPIYHMAQEINPYLITSNNQKIKITFNMGITKTFSFNTTKETNHSAVKFKSKPILESISHLLKQWSKPLNSKLGIKVCDNEICCELVCFNKIDPLEKVHSLEKIAAPEPPSQIIQENFKETEVKDTKEDHEKLATNENYKKSSIKNFTSEEEIKVTYYDDEIISLDESIIEKRIQNKVPTPKIHSSVHNASSYNSGINSTIVNGVVPKKQRIYKTVIREVSNTNNAVKEKAEEPRPISKEKKTIIKTTKNISNKSIKHIQIQLHKRPAPNFSREFKEAVDIIWHKAFERYVYFHGVAIKYSDFESLNLENKDGTYFEFLKQNSSDEEDDDNGFSKYWDNNFSKRHNEDKYRTKKVRKKLNKAHDVTVESLGSDSLEDIILYYAPSTSRHTERSKAYIDPYKKTTNSVEQRSKRKRILKFKLTPFQNLLNVSNDFSSVVVYTDLADKISFANVSVDKNVTEEKKLRDKTPWTKYHPPSMFERPVRQVNKCSARATYHGSTRPVSSFYRNAPIDPDNVSCVSHKTDNSVYDMDSISKKTLASHAHTTIGNCFESPKKIVEPSMQSISKNSAKSSVASLSYDIIKMMDPKNKITQQDIKKKLAEYLRREGIDECTLKNMIRKCKSNELDLDSVCEEILTKKQQKRAGTVPS